MDNAIFVLWLDDINTSVDEIIIFIVLYCGFENSRTPKTYFTNCKLTPYTTTSPHFNRRIIMGHERMHISS